MSANINDGGSAFPIFPESCVGHGAAFKGMMLRDYFAAKFMSCAQSLYETNDGWEIDNAAHCAYQMADAMLKVRSA
jgi:hypothetical protein